jgi:chitin deacetylase
MRTHHFSELQRHSEPMSLDPNYPRDLIGYGRHPVQANWPGRARVAVQFVLNYEEGGENCVLHGDPGSEQFLSEIVGAAAYPDRHMSMESIYEYGSRAGVWRILREFEKRGLPLTVFGVGMAIERHPELARAFVELGHEIACHGWRWIHYQSMTPELEAEHMRLGMEAIERVTGERPLGWYTGRDSPNTHRLVAEYGGFLYDSDNYGDDLPFWMDVAVSGGRTTPQLIVPTRSTRTTCASRRRRASTPASTSSTTCATRSTCCTPKATKRRRCCRSACTAACSGGRGVFAGCSVSSITSRSTSAYG